MRKKLTETVVNQKAEGEIWDKLLPGFGIRIGARKRTYFVMGRCWSAKKGKNVQARRTVGTTIELSLGEAREKARGMLADLAKGVDPVEAEKRQRLEAARQQRTTFAGVAAAYLEERGCLRKDASELERKLRKELLPVIGHIPIADLRRADVKNLVFEKAKVARVQARLLKQLISLVCGFAVDEGLLDANPVTRIIVPTNPPRERFLSDVEIARFWNGLQFLRLDPVDRILKLLLVCAQRRNEVTLMAWSELDLDEGRWELPSARNKSGRPHFVPLTRLALDLIGQPDGHEHVFHRPDGSPIPGNTVSHTMWRTRKGLDLADLRVHDLRRSSASGMSKLGIDRLVISKLLGHAEGGITKIYDRWDYWDRKVLAMEAWSEHINAVVTGQPAPSNVRRLERVG